jgi:hypothetical protein
VWEARAVTGPSAALELDLGDFDAVGLLSEVVVDLRAHVMVHEREAAATISAPTGWHQLVVNAKQGGSTVLVVRFSSLTASRLRNVASALTNRGWQLDEDREGATLRQPPGTAAADVAFEALGALAVAGAPKDVRAVTMIDADGGAVARG